MAISKNTVWLAKDGSVYRTQNNLVLLSNARDVTSGTVTGEYNDTAQYIGSYAFLWNPDLGYIEESGSSGDKDWDAYTIALYGNTVNLEIGGNYQSDKDSSNIHFVKKTYTGKSAQTVYFVEDGILHLTAQNGASSVNSTATIDGEKVSDDGILLIMNGGLTAATKKDEGADFSVAVVRAEKSLEVSSDLAGTFQVDKASISTEHPASGKITGIYAVRAEEIGIKGNYRANLVIQNSSVDVTDHTLFNLTGTFVHIAGISSDKDFSSTRAWINGIRISGNTASVDLDGRTGVDTDAEDPWEHPVIANNYQSVTGVEVVRERGTLLSFSSIGFNGGTGAWKSGSAAMHVDGGDTTYYAYAKQDYTKETVAGVTVLKPLGIPTATVTGNTILVAALNANTITLGDVAAEASFDVSSGTTSIRAEVENGKLVTTEGTATVTLYANALEVTGFNADTITVDSFAGTISVAGGEGTFTAAQESLNGDTATFITELVDTTKKLKRYNSLLVAGIFADDRLTVSSYFGGAITVSRGTTSGVSERGGTTSIFTVANFAYGILTPYFEDQGRIAVNISNSGSKLLDACIMAGTASYEDGTRLNLIIHGGTICTDAITGSLSGAEIGIAVRDAFVSPYYRVSSEDAAGDSIDITGFIGDTTTSQGMKYALKVGSETGCSIRVSGRIMVDAANYAVATEYYTEENENAAIGLATQDKTQDDLVEIATNAVIADDSKRKTAIKTILKGGTIYASGDQDKILSVAGGTVFGLISGGTVTGKIRLGKSAANNWAIISTQATLGVQGQIFHFVGDEGLLNLSFQLDGKAQSRAVYLTDFEDASMTSTTTIGINCDYAKSGDTYKLIQYNADISGKWEERKVTFVWRGQEETVYFDGKTTVTVNFVDDKTKKKSEQKIEMTATLEMVKDADTGTSTLQVKVEKTKFASSLATLDVSYVSESWNTEDNTYTIDWSPAIKYWSTAMANLDYYEIEYSINGENTIVTRLNKDQTKLVISQILPGDDILWRIRGVDINLQNAGYYVGETQWSRYKGQICDQDVTRSISMNLSFADASGQYTRDSAKVNGAAALVYWDPAVVQNTTVDHYVVEYYESLTQLTDVDAEKKLDSTTTSIKHTSDTSVMLSSLTSRCYIYWRVKAVDVYGNESAYKMGEVFRVFDGDSTGPTFTDSNVDVVYKRNGSNVNITVKWAAAEDKGTGASGVKQYKITLTGAGETLSKIVKQEDGKDSYTCSFADVAKSNYTVTVTAYDYSKNTTTITSGTASAPVLDADSFNINYVKNSASYVTLKADWDQAVSASGIAIDKYVVTVWQNDVAMFSETVTDTGKSHYTTTFSNRDFAVGEYTITVQAYDLAQNQSEVVSKNRICGGLDLNGDWENVVAQPEIAVTYDSAVWVDYGYTHIDTTTGTLSTGYYVQPVKTAKATFTWSDTFNNKRGISYALDFSDTQDFSGTVFSYYTKEDEVVFSGGTRTVTLDQSAEHPISILEAVSGGAANKVIYWRVRAGGIDDSGFASNMTSTINTFYFTDTTAANGTVIVHRQAPAQATVSIEQARSGSGTAANVYDGKLDIAIETSQTELGIAKYKVVLQNLTKTKYVYTWTGDYNDSIVSNSFTKTFDLTQIFGSVNYDGTYCVTVTTYDAAGNAGAATTQNVVVDTIAPTKTASVTTQAFAGCVVVNWKASKDASGIQKYIVKGRRNGSSVWQDMLTVAGTTTTATVSGLSDGSYQFAVCAVDNNGNTSEYSEVSSVDVYAESDYEDNYIPDKWVTYSGTRFTPNNSIGSADKADYFCIACDVACTLSMSLTGLAHKSGTSLGITVSFYKYNGTGKEQPIQTFSLTSKKRLLVNYALTAGEYFVKVTANNATAIDLYGMSVTKKNFSTAAYNTTADNNWKKLTANGYKSLTTSAGVSDWVGFGDNVDYRRVSIASSGNYSFNLKTTSDPATITLYQKSGSKLVAVKSVSTTAASNYRTMSVALDKANTYYIRVTPGGTATLKDCDYQVSLVQNCSYKGAYVSHNDDTATLAAKNYTALSMENSIVQDWVGFSDDVDYRKLSLKYGGNYNLRLSGITHAVNFTLYQKVGTKLVTMQSITIDPAEGRSATGKIGNVWLDSSANATYFVSVTALNAADEKNTNYLLNLSAFTIYSEGARNDDDTAALAEKNKYLLAYGGTVSDEWVGFGDEIDYRAVKITESGNYKFTISGVQNAVTLKLWESVDGNLKWVNSKKVTSGSYTLQQLLDKDKTYFVSVSCNNCDAQHNSKYQLTLTGTEYPRAKHGDDWSNLAAAGAASSEYGSFGVLESKDVGSALTRRDNVTGEQYTTTNWLSYGDEVDYVKFTLNSAAKLVFNFQSTGNVKAAFSVNSLEKGKSGYYLNELGSVKTCASTGKTTLWLEQGTYYIAAEAFNAASDGKGNYSVSLDESSVFYPKSVTGNTDDLKRAMEYQTEPRQITAEGVSLPDDWVGFGNAEDYWKIQLDQDGKLQIALEDQDTWDAYQAGKIKLDLVDVEGKSIDFSQSGKLFTTDDEITGGGRICYFGVVCTNDKKYSVDYTAKLSVIAIK